MISVKSRNETVFESKGSGIRGPGSGVRVQLCDQLCGL